MDRGEFLSTLRESLEGCIPKDEVEKNIRFYRDYFEESGRSDKEVMEELGDPRLIARTIIEAYKASKGPMADYYTEQARNEYSREHSEQFNHSADTEGSFYRQYGGERKWYEKVIGWVMFLFILSAVLVLAFKIVGLFLGYVLPVLLLVLVVKLLVDNFRK